MMARPAGDTDQSVPVTLFLSADHGREFIVGIAGHDSVDKIHSETDCA